MKPIESSETSAYNNTLTPGTYPKEKKLQSKHGESLKSGNNIVFRAVLGRAQSFIQFLSWVPSLAKGGRIVKLAIYLHIISELRVGGGKLPPYEPSANG